MGKLFEPARFGDLSLRNRIILAPLTRTRAVEARTPNALMRDYYVQRAGAGLEITEATSVTPMGVGYPNTPGIWSEEQVAGWRVITDAVHAAGGQILLQLWHVGRISHPLYLGWRTPGRAKRHRAQGKCQPRASAHGICDAARPEARRNSGRHRGLPQGRREFAARGF
ncbi:MAG: hypothetical protein WDM79_06720 [Terricaulis sp.]